ncbi:TetR family transcriptional regulator [Georgenia soli]|uniref:TetR family transcriptional regulator n=1 Tax=Georgenia soli TaxID=638953 RepID=A0A2A9EKV9_9MICO|nr:TetR/AcrR family transcriptional regulator [Georgenia soli]PFG39538.1 TetR family transcriptional regulator [Georgenia soli]
MSRRDEIVEAAVAVLEAEGLDAVSMRRIATELGIQAPSLYKHVGGKEDIEAALQERALEGMTTALVAAGDDLERLGLAYRRWALDNPGLYEVATRRPLLRDRIRPGVEEAAAAPIVRVAGGDEHLARALWALAHGLVDLELRHRFPPGADLDATWRTALGQLGGPAVR